jgi:hypothetical protein
MPSRILVEAGLVSEEEYKAVLNSAGGTGTQGNAKKRVGRK